MRLNNKYNDDTQIKMKYWWYINSNISGYKIVYVNTIVRVWL